jgi:hypothetical protein
MAIDTKLLEDDAKMNATFPAKVGGPLKRRMSQEALQRIIDDEGPEVMTAAAEGYWRDQDKRFPHLTARQSNERRVFSGFGSGRRGDANPRRMRLVEGVWMERVHGKWERAT